MNIVLSQLLRNLVQLLVLSVFVNVEVSAATSGVQHAFELGNSDSRQRAGEGEESTDIFAKTPETTRVQSQSHRKHLWKIVSAIAGIGVVVWGGTKLLARPTSSHPNPEGATKSVEAPIIAVNVSNTTTSLTSSFNDAQVREVLSNAAGLTNSEVTECLSGLASQSSCAEGQYLGIYAQTVSKLTKKYPNAFVPITMDTVDECFEDAEKVLGVLDVYNEFAKTAKNFDFYTLVTPLHQLSSVWKRLIWTKNRQWLIQLLSLDQNSFMVQFGELFDYIYIASQLPKKSSGESEKTAYLQETEGLLNRATSEFITTIKSLNGQESENCDQCQKNVKVYVEFRNRLSAALERQWCGLFSDGIITIFTNNVFDRALRRDEAFKTNITDECIENFSRWMLLTLQEKKSTALSGKDSQNPPKLQEAYEALSKMVTAS
jgi:hypothetical protein